MNDASGEPGKTPEYLALPAHRGSVQADPPSPILVGLFTETATNKNLDLFLQGPSRNQKQEEGEITPSRVDEGMSAIVNNLGATTVDSLAKMFVDEVDESSGRRKRPTVANLPKVVILHGSRAQDVTEEQTTQIQEGIVKLVDGIPEGDFVPRFHETYRTKGVLKVICADTQSEGWLGERLPTLAMWEGSGLTIVGFDELPKFVRVSAFLPGPAPADKKTILGRLEKQNPGH
ncbi:hypothetical protein RF55_19202 [Lasius niger]|uniref:DUF4780 domain-containing protein n=1 Tax=Lasius niger TaxID=67767 RepID=A0A0J7K0A5_LASNI|nr:hypothetical protein RF55_19202 [Lasius niger]